MIKRITCIFLILVLTCCLFGCNKKEIHDPINFYYRAKEIAYGTDNGVIFCEVRDKFGYAEDYVYLINYYLQGPIYGECFSPFPAGTTLVQLELVKDKAIVTLSSHISLLHGAELSIACTCLAKTVHEITSMKYVQISSEGDLLDGEAFILFENDAYVTTDTFEPSPTEA